MKPLVTFIVPIYNTEKYLKRCLDSICAQTYTEWETILVNDGSTDGSGRICREYVEKDSRFHVIEQANSGLPNARNAGIDAARGKYVAFMDSDDWVDERYLEFLVYKAELENLDLVMCHTLAEYPNGKSVEIERMTVTEKIVRGKELEPLKLYSYNSGFLKEKYGFFNTAWGKIHKLEVLKKSGLRFNEKCKLVEDQLFQSEFLEFADGIGIYHRILYHYRMSDASAAHRFRENYLEQVDSYLRYNQELINKYHENDKLFQRQHYNQVCQMLLLILKCYIFNPNYQKCTKNKISILKNLIKEDMYDTALKKKDFKALKNIESKVILSLIQVHFYSLVGGYFYVRPFLKRIIIHFRG